MSRIKDIKLQFKNADLDFTFGDRINGSLSFTPVNDLNNTLIVLNYQWRTHGQTKPRWGNVRSITISITRTWQKGEPYHLPFSFMIKSGPRSYHGHAEKLDWYTWITLRTNDKGDNRLRQYTETEISLQNKAGNLLVSPKKTTSNQILYSIIKLFLVIIGGYLFLPCWPRLQAEIANSRLLPDELIYFLPMVLLAGVAFLYFYPMKLGIPEFWLGN